MAGPSPSSAPSTPSTHTPGEVISMPALPHSGSSSKPLMMFGPDGTGTLTSPSNQLWDDKDLELQADMDRFVEDGSLDDNVESFLSHDDMGSHLRKYTLLKQAQARLLAVTSHRMESFLLVVAMIKSLANLSVPLWGHSDYVMSLDFHPNKDDLICSCDLDGQICYWEY
ncbi:unnamed protein product [Prunus armeniaca]